MRRQQYPTSGQRGFTLVEAIVVMVLTAILAGTMVMFIRRPVQNYTDAAARAGLSDVADLALRRMARELRTALPNSARLTVAGGVSWLEFIPTVSGGKYLAVENNTPNGTPLSFTNSNAVPFSVIGPMPALAQVGQSFLAIYNLGPGFTNADAYARGNLALVTGINAGNRTIAYESYAIGQAGGNGKNPFAVTPPNVSPGQRFQIVTRPVTFRCEGAANGTGTLTRSVAADFLAAQPRPTAAQGNLLANNVQACSFSIGALASQQGALIGVSLALARAIAGGGIPVETVTLSQQIHVDNTP